MRELQERAKRLADALYDAGWDEASGLTLRDCLASTGITLTEDTKGESPRAYVDAINSVPPSQCE